MDNYKFEVVITLDFNADKAAVDEILLAEKWTIDDYKKMLAEQFTALITDELGDDAQDLKIETKLNMILHQGEPGE